jgi:CRP/FNR family transcriptional regulator, cyclic AMP receptor protein
MTARRIEQGEILFRKNDPSHEMYYLLSGEIDLREVGKIVGPGTMLGEIAMFSPDRKRTATAICARGGELLAINDDQVRQLYFQNPTFGFYLVQLITRRPLENAARLEALPAGSPAVERPRLKVAA